MLKERQLDVLRLVVQLFTATGQPVGSAKLRDLGIQASSATIRNDLALLEQLGLLEKTHVSSGRVPSMEGYRYYVDHLVHPLPIGESERSSMRQLFSHDFFALDDLMNEAVTLLADLTGMTAIIIGSDTGEQRLTDFRLMRINQTQGMAVIALNKSDITSRVFPIPEQLADDDFEQMMTVAKKRFIGETIHTVWQRLRTELPLTLRQYVNYPAEVLKLFEQIFYHTLQTKRYMSGEMNVFNYMQDLDVIQMKQLLSLFSDDERMKAILDDVHSSTMSVRIGDELSDDVLQNMALMTTAYRTEDHGTGLIALFGPSNMAYAKTIGLLDEFRKELQYQVANYYKKLDASD